MRQQQFESEQAPIWEAYREVLAQLEKPARKPDPASALHRFPNLYRQICGHYALARSRRYSPRLTDELHDLVSRGYPHLYRKRPSWLRRSIEFLASDFPSTLRRNWKLLALSVLLFFGPMAGMGTACFHDGELIYSLLDGETVSRLESMYDPTNRRSGRDAQHQADSNFAMFGFYVMNNVGIAFRAFAGGLVLGLGSLFILGFNGLFVGAAAGHLTALGYGGIFWPFVSGHSALELTAIAIAGAAGLLLAAALIAPGRRPRREALRANASEALELVMGALAMLVLAALVEAFWSSDMGTAPLVKYLIGALWWLLLILYFSLAGKSDGDAA